MHRQASSPWLQHRRTVYEINRRTFVVETCDKGEAYSMGTRDPVYTTHGKVQIREITQRKS